MALLVPIRVYTLSKKFVALHPHARVAELLRRRSPSADAWQQCLLPF